MADKVYESILNHTPLLHEKKAEFFFVANNPTKEVLNHLKEKNYPFIECWSDVLSEEQMDKLGYAKPNYMRNVYQGYNFNLQDLKISENLCDCVLSIPMHPYLEDEQVKTVCDAVKKAIIEYRK